MRSGSTIDSIKEPALHDFLSLVQSDRSYQGTVLGRTRRTNQSIIYNKIRRVFHMRELVLVGVSLPSVDKTTHGEPE